MKLRNIFSAIAAIFALGAVAITPSVSAAMVQSGADILYSGTWTKKSQKSAGNWSIYREGDTTYLKLSADFKTRGAPDLKLFLSPQAASAANGKNATNGAVLIAPLQSNKGEQVYTIPAGVDLANFSSVLIHCEQYSKLWSAADL